MVPVIRRMIRKGLPVSCALTYLLAAPIVNPIVALSTFAAFRGQHPGLTMSVRVAMGFAVALVCGLVIHRLPIARVLNRGMLNSPSKRRLSMGSRLSAPPQQENASLAATSDDPQPKKSFGKKMIGAVRCASFDFLDVGFYLVIGAAIASVFNTAVHRDAILPLAQHSGLATGSMMALAFLLSLCSTSDAFIAASFVTFPFAAKVAFMVFGPMMDVKLLFMYSLVFRKRFTVTFALALFLLIGLLCVGLSYFR